MFKLANLLKRKTPEVIPEPAPQLTSEPTHEPANLDALHEQIIAAIKTVFDPEIPVNLYDLGLIYQIDIKHQETGEPRIFINMTLTAPACPVAEMMPGMVADAIKKNVGVNSVKVDLVWEPPWTAEKMSDEAKLELGIL